jgi:hypothetical protein
MDSFHSVVSFSLLFVFPCRPLPTPCHESLKYQSFQSDFLASEGRQRLSLSLGAVHSKLFWFSVSVSLSAHLPPPPGIRRAPARVLPWGFSSWNFSVLQGSQNCHQFHTTFKKTKMLAFNTFLFFLLHISMLFVQYMYVFGGTGD